MNGAATTTPFYVAGGTLPPEIKSYVTRRADAEIYECLLAGELCYVLTARQMGKSSLIVRAMRRLEAEQVGTAIVDLTHIGKERGAAQSQQWYYGVAYEIHRQLGITRPLRPWWQERLNLPPVQRLDAFLRELVLASRPGRIVVVVDEIDSTIGLPFAEDFFAAIRGCYNARATEPSLERLTFVLVGVASPDQLIHDATRTPFNVGRRIDLGDFTPKEVGGLAAGLHPDPAAAALRLGRVLYWTAGHPYLTQALCRAVAQERAEPSPPDEIVDRVVGDLFLSGKSQQEESNLKHTRARLTAEGAPGRRPLRLYLRIRRGAAVRDQPTSPAFVQLKLSGVVKVSDDGRLVVRNRIYEKVFTAAWARSELPTGRGRQLTAAVLVLVALAAYGLVQRHQTSVLRARNDATRNLASYRLHRGEEFDSRGDALAALGMLREAVSLYDRLDDRKGAAAAHNALGGLFEEVGDSSVALFHFKTALALARREGDKRAQAIALANLGTVTAQIDDLSRARPYLLEALDLYHRLGDVHGSTETLLAIGAIQNAASQQQVARSTFTRALEIAQRLGDVRLQASALLGLAKTLRAEGNPRAAEDAISRCRALLAALRAGKATPKERGIISRMRREVSDEEIDLLMALHRAEPRAGYDRKALEVSETDRVPALIDAVLGQQPESRADRAARRSLIADLNAATAKKLRLQFMPESSDQFAEVLKWVEALARDYESLTARQSRPPDARGASVEEIQRALDRDSLLLEFHLGKRRSFLWALSADGFVSVELPAGKVIEDAATAAIERISVPPPEVPQVDFAERLRTLSRLLLAPVSSLLQRSRLLIVSDAALAHLPFSALPDPGSSAEFLIQRHQIVNLPSMWFTLEARRHAHPRKADGIIAMLADPVFSSGDERAGGVRGSIEGWPRLPASRLEVDGASAMVTPPSRRLVATGFEANRDLVMGGRLQGCSVLHFATHFTFDANHPELSSMVLSLVDQVGRPRDGLIRAYEVPNLDLAASLVVLSGSNSALAENRVGMETMGLSEHFLAQGVPQVIGSLWNVGDRATAELMTRFYRQLVKERRPAAQALAASQMELSRQKRWGSPYYWAGFVVQGLPAASRH